MREERQGMRGVRAAGTVSCGHCGKRGHNARTCPDGYEVAERHARIRELLADVCGFAVAFDRDGCEELRGEVLLLLRSEVAALRAKGGKGDGTNAGSGDVLEHGQSGRGAASERMAKVGSAPVAGSRPPGVPLAGGVVK